MFLIGALITGCDNMICRCRGDAFICCNLCASFSLSKLVFYVLFRKVCQIFLHFLTLSYIFQPSDISRPKKKASRKPCLEHDILRIMIVSLINIGRYIDKHVLFKSKWFRFSSGYQYFQNWPLKLEKSEKFPYWSILGL